MILSKSNSLIKKDFFNYNKYKKLKMKKSLHPNDDEVGHLVIQLYFSLNVSIFSSFLLTYDQFLWSNASIFVKHKHFFFNKYFVMTQLFLVIKSCSVLQKKL